jgi:hypothetical protein
MNYNNLIQDGLRDGQVEALIEKLYTHCEEIEGEVNRKVVKDNHTYQREWEQVSVVIGSTFEIPNIRRQVNAPQKNISTPQIAVKMILLISCFILHSNYIFY